MTTLKPLYGTSTSITITAATLANATARGCAAIDNTSDLAQDVIISVNATVGTVAGTKGINIFFAPSEDGTNYSHEYTGTDAAVTLDSPSNLKGPAFIPTPANTLLYRAQFSFLRMAGLFTMPRKWGLVVDNETGAAFTAFTMTYTPIQFQSV